MRGNGCAHQSARGRSTVASQRRYRLYIDESGDHAYGAKAPRTFTIGTSAGELKLTVDYYPTLEDTNRRYLCLLGCVVETGAYRDSFQPSLEGLKQKHFCNDPDDPPIILHRKELLQKAGPFWRLREPKREQSFNGDLLAFLREQRYTLIAVVIDKKTHIEKYGGNAYHPYHYCVTAMLERYCGLLKFRGAQGDVLAESRGTTEDNALAVAYSRVHEQGTRYWPPAFFQGTLRSKEIKLKPKTANIAGLQIADILAHPVKCEVLLEEGRVASAGTGAFGRRLCQVIQPKYNRHARSNRVSGYGKVFLK